MTSAIYLFFKVITFITAYLAFLIDENFHQCSWPNQAELSLGKEMNSHFNTNECINMHFEESCK